MDLKLYEIANDIAAILSSDEWNDETEAALEACQHSLEVKAGGIVEIIRIAESQAAACREEEQRIAAMRKAREKKAEWLRSYLMRNMEAVGRTEITIGTRTIRIKDNPESVAVDNEAEIPARFFTVIPQSLQLDKNALKAELKKGAIPGAHLTRGKRIEVK